MKGYFERGSVVVVVASTIVHRRTRNSLLEFPSPVKRGSVVSAVSGGRGDIPLNCSSPWFNHDALLASGFVVNCDGL